MKQQAAQISVSTFPYLFLLGIIFILLKITGMVGWSWFWVLSPFWIPIAAWLAGIIFVMAVIVLVALLAVFGLIPRNKNPW